MCWNKTFPSATCDTWKFPLRVITENLRHPPKADCDTNEIESLDELQFIH